MINKKQVSLVLSLFITTNNTYVIAKEEQNRKPSSATRIAQLKERALKFGRCFAGTKEYSSEETQQARAKTIAVLIASGLLLTCGTCYLPRHLFLAKEPSKGKDDVEVGKEKENDTKETEKESSSDSATENHSKTVKEEEGGSPSISRTPPPAGSSSIPEASSNNEISEYSSEEEEQEAPDKFVIIPAPLWPYKVL